MKAIPDKPLRSLDELAVNLGFDRNELEQWWDHRVFECADCNAQGFWFNEAEVTQAVLVWHQ